MVLLSHKETLWFCFPIKKHVTNNEVVMERVALWKGRFEKFCANQQQTSAIVTLL